MAQVIFEAEAMKILAGHEKRFDTNAVIIPEGGPAREFYLLVSGSVSVQVGGEEVRVIDRPGDFFGEVAALSYTTRTATVMAREPSLCFELPTAKLYVILGKSPQLAMRLIHSLAQSLVDTTEYIWQSTARPA